MTCFEDDTDIEGDVLNDKPDGKDYGMGSGMRNTPVDCQNLCQKTNDCKFFSWTKPNICWLKKTKASSKIELNTISGEKCCKKGT